MGTASRCPQTFIERPPVHLVELGLDERQERGFDGFFGETQVAGAQRRAGQMRVVGRRITGVE